VASPFPGVDPHLEKPAYWLGFHSRFVNCWCEAIADALPPNYEAELGERVYLSDADPETSRLRYPDVAVSKSDSRMTGSGSPATGSATLEPVTIPLVISEGLHESYIEILHRPDRSLVAVLELLSPANKEPPGRTEYLAKRMALLRENIHLVELDLILGGRRPPFQKPLPAADYYYLVSRGDRRPDCQVFSWTLRQPLPRVPVPLRAPDPDIFIDLAPVFATAYERGRYRKRIDYQVPPTTLPEKDREWIEGIVRESSNRPR
jgi:hypothetical protein